MLKKVAQRLVLFFYMLVTVASLRTEVHPVEAATLQQVVSDPFSLIGAVNALRASYGLPAYTANSILMSVAQAHAEYMAVTGNVTHIGADGSRPSQRALAASYPLAGDLSLGGFISENIISGRNMSVYDAVTRWMGDAPHQNTMLSPDLSEIGAGVAYVDDAIYYVIDAARPIGAISGIVSSTPQAGATSSTSSSGVGGPTVVLTLITNTPQADGKIIHIVARGETLWLIAVSYGTTIKNLQTLNGLSDSAVIAPGMPLLVGLAPTPLPMTPTLIATPTLEASATLLPTRTDAPPFASTAIIVQTDSSTTSPLSSKVSGMILLAIVLVAFVIAAVATIRVPKGLR